MKSKASLQLMEMLVMILVFAMAAALCLEVFAKSREIALDTARRDRAVALGRNAAEVLKATGDAERAENLAGEGYEIAISKMPNRQEGLAEAEIQVFFEEELIFILHTGWQEVGP